MEKVVDPSATLTSLDLHLQLRKAGALAGTFETLWRAIWSQNRIPLQLLELCRLASARLHGLGAEMNAVNPYAAAEADAEKLAAVCAGQSLDSDLFSSAERAVLFFAEYYWMDPQQITDEAAEDVKDHLGDAGLVLLIEALGCIDARMRVAHVLNGMNAFKKEHAHV